MIFEVRRLHFSCFFNVFSIRFRHRFLHRFFHGFGTHFGSIFEPLATRWASFWHTFSASIFSWVFDAILADFWTPISGTNRNPKHHFFHYFSCFFWVSFQGSIFMDFGPIFDGFSWILDRCLMDFHGFWNNFRIIFTSVLELVRYCLHPFPYRFNTFDKAES